MSRLTAARAATHLAGALTVATAATLVPATTAAAAPSTALRKRVKQEETYQAKAAPVKCAAAQGS